MCVASGPVKDTRSEPIKQIQGRPKYEVKDNLSSIKKV